MCVLWSCVTHLEQTFCQSPPDLRPQKGAKEEQGYFHPGNVRVIQESPFGELQTAIATVSPCTQHDGGGSADEVQVSRHGLHFHRPGAPRVTAHCSAAQKEKKPGGKSLRLRDTEIPGKLHSPDGVTNPSTSLLAHLKKTRKINLYLTSLPSSVA